MSAIDRNAEWFFEKALRDVAKLLHVAYAAKLLECGFEIFHEINIDGRLYMAFEIQKTIPQNSARAIGDGACEKDGGEGYKGIASIKPGYTRRKIRS